MEEEGERDYKSLRQEEEVLVIVSMLCGPVVFVMWSSECALWQLIVICSKEKDEVNDDFKISEGAAVSREGFCCW